MTELAKVLLLAALMGTTACAEPEADAPTNTHLEHDSLDGHPMWNSSGYFELEDGPVAPFCLGVLTTPRQALVPWGCLGHTHPTWLTFKTGADASAKPVDVVKAPEDSIEPDSLGWVVDLAEAPMDARPAPRATSLPRAGDVLDVGAFTYRAVVDDQKPERRVWRAEVVEAGEGYFVADLLDGVSGCHGDLGAAAYDRTGALAGILTGTDEGGPVHPINDGCVTRFVFEVL